MTQNAKCTALAIPIACGNITFTHSRLDAEKYVIQQSDQQMQICCPAVTDIFCDPNGKISNNSLPMLLCTVDNTKPFTLQAKVTSGFTPDGLYNAADLVIFAHDTLWQKLCFEQDDYGHYRVVSVRTDGTSDDCNHDPHDVPSLYLKISSDTHTVGCYYSLNGKDWVMVRVSKNSYPQQLFVGIASQCPSKGECCSTFAELGLDTANVSDFRTGS